MTNLNGGYIIIAKNDADAYAKANKALTLGKPILFYEDNTTCYYIDTITLDGTDIILTKGGKTITIEADGDITETGNVQNHLYALTFNVCDMYYTIFTKTSCGLQDKIINDSDNPTTIILTNEEKTKLYNAYKNALTNGSIYLIGNITGDTSSYANYSNLSYLVFRNTDEDEYSLGMTFENNNIAIVNNPFNDEIKVYEEQIF